MIASPGDVHDLRLAARDVILEWNCVHSSDRNIVLIPVAWETNASPELGTQPQDLIDSRLLEDCDLLVGIFWTRLGTPTRKEASGTVQEIRKHVAAGKPAMVYFNKAALPQPIDVEQYSKLQDFMQWCRSEGLIAEFKDEHEFKRLFARQLQQELLCNKHLQKTISETKPQPKPEPEPSALRALPLVTNVQRYLEAQTPNARASKLSTLSKEILLAIAEQPSGQMMVVGTGTRVGLDVVVGQRQFLTEDSTHRDVMICKEAIRELTEANYIRRLGRGEIYEITTGGYAMADFLKSVA